MKKLDITIRPTRAQEKKIKTLARTPRFDVVNFDWKGQDHYRVKPREDGGVAVVLRRADGKFLMVKQRRPFMKRAFFELVCGGKNAGESTILAAKREVLEETGYRVRRLTCLVDYAANPWASLANGSLFWAEVGNAPEERPTEADMPDATVVVLSAKQLKEALKKGQVNYFSATWLLYALFLKDMISFRK